MYLHIMHIGIDNVFLNEFFLENNVETSFNF